MLFISLGGYMLKNTKDITFLHFFPDYSYESYKIYLSDLAGSDL